MTAVSLGLSPARRAVLGRRIRWFVAATISYNVIEAVVALAIPPACRDDEDDSGCRCQDSCGCN